MEEGKYKGLRWRIIYSGYEIEKIGSFQTCAGNHLLGIPEDERERKLKSKIRYEINKFIGNKNA